MTEKNIKFTLMIQVGECSGDLAPYINAHVQVWNDDEHVTTFKLLDLVSLEFPETAALQTVESYATTAARVAARMLDEKLFERIQTAGVHSRHDLAAEYAVWVSQNRA